MRHDLTQAFVQGTGHPIVSAVLIKAATTEARNMHFSMLFKEGRGHIFPVEMAKPDSYPFYSANPSIAEQGEGVICVRCR